MSDMQQLTLHISSSKCLTELFVWLQLNLKFEIEVLCKNLSLDINDLKPGNLLKDKDKLKSLEEQLSAPKKETKPPEEMLPIVTTGVCAHSILCILFLVSLFRVCFQSLTVACSQSNFFVCVCVISVLICCASRLAMQLPLP